MNSWYLIAAIVILYFIFAFSKNFIRRVFKIAPCSICAAVSISWITALIYHLFAGKIDLMLIAILIGQSIAGFMYKMEDWFKKLNLSKFWLMRIVIIAGGTAVMYSFLKREYNLTMIFAVVSIILMIVVAVLQKPGAAEHKKHSKIEDMLDNCC